MTVCSYHVPYAFQSESTLTTQLSHLVSLAKWLSVRLRTKWYWVRIALLSCKAFFRSFSGANSKQLNHYIIPTLLDDKPGKPGEMAFIYKTLVQISSLEIFTRF